MGISSYKRTSENKKIWLDEQETVYVIGRPYGGKDFNAQAARVAARYQVEKRLAIKKKDYNKQLEIAKRIGLEAAVNSSCIAEVGDTEGFKVTEKGIVDLLMQDGYQTLMDDIDRVLDVSSMEFSLSEEDSIQEGKRLLSTLGGGGELPIAIKV
jgi:hypothetical protein